MAGYSDLWRSSIVAAVSYDSAQTLCDVVQGARRFNSSGSAARGFWLGGEASEGVERWMCRSPGSAVESVAG